jgi:hypothetical protein
MGFVAADNSLTDFPTKPMAYGIFVSGRNADLVSDLISWLNDSKLQASLNAAPVSGGRISGTENCPAIPAAVIYVGVKPLTSTP